MKKEKILLALFLSLLFVTYVLADTVVLKSGQKVEGKITERTDKYVKINFQGVELVYYQDEIASIIESERRVSASGADLSFKPSYAPIDFSGLAEHYPTESELSAAQDEYSPESIIGESDFGATVGLVKEGLSENTKKAAPLSADLSSATANLPPEYREMIKTIQNNPQDISAALSQMPAEYRGMVEGAMKNIPQVQGSGADKKKE